eukprot:GEMP01002065.1.p1 GENE.GEMP01002065.1~~GEMP01002065.1.p1  ORF type:complete len:991 (+),score=261.27 GEMP01002065.1:118-3090(+)
MYNVESENRAKRMNGGNEGHSTAAASSSAPARPPPNRPDAHSFASVSSHTTLPWRHQQAGGESNSLHQQETQSFVIDEAPAGGDEARITNADPPAEGRPSRASTSETIVASMPSPGVSPSMSSTAPVPPKHPPPQRSLLFATPSAFKQSFSLLNMAPPSLSIPHTIFTPRPPAPTALAHQRCISIRPPSSSMRQAPALSGSVQQDPRYTPQFPQERFMRSYGASGGWNNYAGTQDYAPEGIPYNAVGSTVGGGGPGAYSTLASSYSQLEDTSLSLAERTNALMTHSSAQTQSIHHPAYHSLPPTAPLHHPSLVRPPLYSPPTHGTPHSYNNVHHATLPPSYAPVPHIPTYHSLPPQHFAPPHPHIHRQHSGPFAASSAYVGSSPAMSPHVSAVRPSSGGAAASSAGRSKPAVWDKDGVWAYDKPQLLNLHVMYLSDLPKHDTWMSSVQYVISIHSGSNPVKAAAPPRLLPSFNPKDMTTLPVVTKPANVFDSVSAESLSREDQLQTQVFTHLSDLRLAKKCVAEEGEKCFFDEKFLISLPKFEEYAMVNIWRLSTTYVTARKEYTMYGQVYLPLGDPTWNKKVCTWPLVDPENTEKDVIGNGTFLFSLASTPEPCEKITVLSVNKRTVSLEWTEPSSDNGSPIKGYRIQYKKVYDQPQLPKFPIRKAYGDSSGRPQTGDEYEWQTVADMLKETRFTVEHLAGNTQFAFRVAAQNFVGVGDAIESTVVRTGPVPPSAPGKPKMIGRSPDGISQVFLEWDAPESNNGAPICGHRLWAKSLLSDTQRWIDVGEISAGPTTVPSTDDPSVDKVVYRAKITSLPTSGPIMVTCAAMNEAGLGPSSEEDRVLAFDWTGEVWEVEEDIGEPPPMERLEETILHEEPSATQVRLEQDNDYQISLLHDEVQAHMKEQEQLFLKVGQLRDEIDEQESLAKMARQRMEAWGADNPNISKALEDATAKLDELNKEAEDAAASVRTATALIDDKRAILQALEF